jgi:MFS family permease
VLGGTWLWGGVSLGGVLLFLLGSRLFLLGRLAQPAGVRGGQTSYLTAIRSFSRNAKLFLTYSIMAELGTGIWGVMFNLYLLRSGYPVTFIGTFWLINMVCHGAASLPAGLIADRFGRRRAFFIATCISILAQGSLLFTQDPMAILALAGVAGFGEAFHGVTGAPFMMENSEPRERAHLFSLNSSFLQFSRFGGNMMGGFLPLLWAGALGVPAGEPTAARWALVTGLPLTVLALVPLAFMREKPVELVESFKDLVTLRNVVNMGIVAKLAMLSLLVGVAFGLTIRFFNIFFEEVHSAADSQIGTILALGSLASAGSVLISPVLTQVWGKAKGIFLTQALSVPFLLLMATVPSLSAVTVFFLMRGAVYGIAMPMRNQLSMEFITAKERGTTAGFTHMAFDLGGGAGAGVAGFLIASGGFTTAFVAAGVLILVPAFLYFWFFAGLEMRGRRPVPVPSGAGR